jgi:hypothetical protein
MEESRNAFRILVGKSLGERPLGRARGRWRDVKDMEEIGCERGRWMYSSGLCFWKLRKFRLFYQK